MAQTEKMQVQERINALMTEYSQRKQANESPKLLKRLTTEAYMLMIDSSNTPCSRELRDKIQYYLNINELQSTPYEPNDVMNECFLIAMESYDCRNNPNFWAYFQALTRNWISDKIFKKNSRVIGKDANGKHIRESWLIPDIDKNDDEEMVTITETQPDQTPNPEEMLASKENSDVGAKAKIAALITNVVGFYLHNQANTLYQEKIRYYRSFTTDYMICFAKQKVFETVPVNEQDAFLAMDCDFLDYLMTTVCRTLHTVELTPLKTYAQLDISKRGDVKLPLMAIVYKAYFAKQYQKTFTDSALSQQRDAFFNLLGIDKHAHTWVLPEHEEANV